MDSQNQRLASLVSEWRAIGAPHQEAFPWALSKPKWLQLADEFKVDIEHFPDMIDRQFLWSLSSSGAPVTSLFLAVMVWGYGDIGYGPYRVRQMFESEKFDQSIHTIKEMCDERESIKAYEALRDAHIRQLGPSFGSKVLTFFHAIDSAPAILDSIVATWLNKHVPGLLGSKSVNAETWNLKTYESYTDWIHYESLAHKVSACTLEQLIFTDEYAA